ncbi:hypothetical protein DFJ73DRAFT_861059 [Zopfochytrium polystomum]|nr:hypothetical protein DFJ73DRAFT_861059 [Zopfochytrium polystomum]
MATRLTVTEGVTGGFVAPTPRRSAILDFGGSNPPSIQLHTKRRGTRDQYDVTATDPAALGAFTAELDSVVATVLQTFKTLPLEQPTACEDIYGCDISIAIESPGFRWQNIPNQGCAASPSSVQPTEAQKALFKEIADSIFALANKHAKTPVAA